MLYIQLQNPKRHWKKKLLPETTKEFHKQSIVSFLVMFQKELQNKCMWILPPTQLRG